MNAKPYYTTTRLVEAIKTNIMFPVSQNTLTYNNIVEMINQEIHMSAVPAIKELHAEYFVYKCKPVPLVSNISRYGIPSRALGGALRDLCWSDASGNLNKMQRIAPEDKAFFQQNSGSNQQISLYYIEGNDVVLSAQMISGPTGSLNFFVFLRPNFLVRDDRASFIQGFQKAITVSDYTQIQAGDTITITTNVQTPSPTISTFTAVTGSPGPMEYLIGTDNITTAANINGAINSANIEDFTSMVSTNIATTSYSDITTTFLVEGSGIDIDITNLYVQFDSLASTYTDPETNETSSLYTVGSTVDFLQTDPGHKTYTYDIKLRAILSGNVGKFKLSDLQTTMTTGNVNIVETYKINVGDYICLSNECIIPQIPSELHVALIERTSARMLKSIGDKEGYAIAKAEIAEMDKQQATMIGQRIDGAPPKVFNSNSLLRVSKRRIRRRV